MEDDEGGGPRLSKRFSDKGEVDYKTKAGTAWSHNFLNQKPWHPLSYPNQRRKWIAEQTDAQRQRRAQEVAREFSQEQEFFRQTALVSKKEKEKVETMKAVSFMYVRPPGYNAESAKAAEIADERKRLEQCTPSLDSTDGAPAMEPESMPGKDRLNEEKKKSRPKDVFGRALPTEEEFEVLKNAPRMETGMPARVKPFAVEVRNVKCVRCGNYGHQSGDRECPLKDAIMPNDESRLRRDDPLAAIVAQTDFSEPPKWELKQKPGMSPPRGGFKPDDPNQQIIAEDIFDEYGGFLGDGNIPDLLTNFPVSKSRKHSKSKGKQKSKSSATGSRRESKSHYIDRSDYDAVKDRRIKEEKKHKKKKRHQSITSSSDNSEIDRRHRRRSKLRHSASSSSENSDSSRRERRRKCRGSVSVSYASDNSNSDGDRKRNKHRHRHHHHHSHRHSTQVSD